MKRIVYGLTAILLAISGFAGNYAHKSKIVYYYFKYTVNGVGVYTFEPSPTSFDCKGTVTKCQIAATSYLVANGIYTPSGSWRLSYKDGL